MGEWTERKHAGAVCLSMGEVGGAELALNTQLVETQVIFLSFEAANDLVWDH